MFLVCIYSCSKDDSINLEYNNLKSIEIGDYEFQVPSRFMLVEGQGIDSYIGQLRGAGIELSFDFGYYSGGPNSYIPVDTYNVVRDTIDGHVREILIALNPMADYTSINFYSLDGYSEVINSYQALSMGSNGLSPEEQELVISIFESGYPIN